MFRKARLKEGVRDWGLIFAINHRWEALILSWDIKRGFKHGKYVLKNAFFLHV